MNRFFTKSIALIALVGAVTAFSASKAEAAFVAAICNDAACDGVGDIIIEDNDLGDSVASLGRISINGSVGGLDFVSNLSRSKPVIGSDAEPEMDLDFSADGIGEAWIYASDTDFTGVNRTLNSSADGNWSGSGEVQSFIGAFASNLNVYTGLTASATDISSPFSIQQSLGTGAVSPYSITIGIRVKRTSAGVTSGDLIMTSVPEPMTLSLLGLGLAGLAARRRRVL